ncbi:MAG: DUF4091 domain-containing protein [Clostridia bacterium]|nr:DUF4091 domain-containing protein [Clostridia bacterium]
MYRWKLTNSLEKIFFHNFDELKETVSGSMLKNEIHSFQLAGEFENTEFVTVECKVEIESELLPYISIYKIGYSVNDMPSIQIEDDDDYITKEPGLFPDPLHKVKDGKFTLVDHQVRGLWVAVEPEGKINGIFPIKFRLFDKDGALSSELTYTLKIIDAELPKQELLNTGWFHGDCLAVLHNVEIGSEKYFEIVDKYMRVYAKFGHNMILTPVFTPPLDTAIGSERPTNQLVDVAVTDGKYSFGFEKLGHWIDLCRKNGIEYYEISHLFTQWGAKFAPKVMATVDGEYKRIFGWETEGTSDEYKTFMTEFLSELTAFLKKEGIYECCYFHVSDEPDSSEEHEKRYREAKEIISAFVSEDKLFDALAEYRYYEKGIIKKPVVASNHIKKFMENGVKNLWTYYCMAQRGGVANRFLAQPSYRNRILGYQLYKYNIEGFLQWGFNFWFSKGSQSVINPYINTTGSTAWPGGDPFVVYPLDTDGNVVCSHRLYVFNDGLQDMRALKLLESLTDRETVMKMLDDVVGFDVYPRNNDYILGLREAINAKIESIVCR